MSGKGSAPRPFDVPREVFESNHARIFGERKKKAAPPTRGTESRQDFTFTALIDPHNDSHIETIDAAVAIAELHALRAEVREWLCEACNTIYPGPPQPGFACVMCPKCGGTTGPRMFMENRRLRAELAARCRAEGGAHKPSSEE